MKSLCLSGLWIYQKFLAPFLGGQCRFHPSCSEYFRAVLQRYRTSRACWLGFKRVLRCNPWLGDGGVDLP